MGLQVLKAASLFGLIGYISLVSFSCKRIKNQEVQKLPYYNTPDFTPLWLTDAKQIDTLHTIAPFKVMDQDGNRINNQTYAGKIYVADFFFTSCPSICPKLTKHFKMISDSFKNESRVGLLSFSVTPDIDSVPRLKYYAGKYGVPSGQWHLVTGNKNEIYKLARKSYFADKEPGFSTDSTEFLHTEHFILVDSHQHIRGIYNGTVLLEVQRLMDDMRLLEKEF